MNKNNDNFEFLPLEENKKSLKKLSKNDNEKLLLKIIDNIKTKDISNIKEIIENHSNINLKPKVNNDYLSMHLMYNFSEEIGDFLLQKGLTFPFCIKLFDESIKKDNISAFLWLKKNNIKTYGDGYNHLISKALDDSKPEIVIHLLKDQNHAKNKNFTDWRINKIIRKLIQKQDKDKLEYILLERQKVKSLNNINDDKNVFKDFLKPSSSIKALSYNNLSWFYYFVKNNERLSVLWKQAFPVSYKLNDRVKDKIKYYKEFNKIKYFRPAGKNILNDKKIEANDLLDVLVINGLSSCVDVIKVKNGKSAIWKKLKNPDFFQAFINGVSSVDAQKIIRSYKREFEDWRDDEGNNITHYLLSITKAKNMIDFSFSFNKKLITIPNNSGVKPLDVIDDKFKNYATKKIINKTLAEEKTSSQYKKSKTRKM